MPKKAITITEALAELRTIAKRIAAKEEFIGGNVGRHSMAVDPHEKDGGSAKLVAEAMQARDDLCERVIAIRTAIQKKNLSTNLTVAGATRTVSEWLSWRRDVESMERGFLQRLSRTIVQTRTKIRNEIPDGMEADLVTHLNEKALADSLEFIEEVSGELDGQLTLSNSTNTITV